MYKSVVVGLFGLLVGCAPVEEDPVLTVKVTPLDAVTTLVLVTAAHGDGTVGAGTVRVRSEVGVLSAGEEAALDAYGTARFEFPCDSSLEPECATSRVTATWMVGGRRFDTTGALPGTIGSGGGGSGGEGGGGSSGGSSGLRMTCSGTTLPGIRPRCCFETNEMPSCGGVVLRHGASYRGRFRSDSGEYREIRIVASASPAIAEKCTATPMGLTFSLDGREHVGNTQWWTSGTIANDDRWSSSTVYRDIPSERLVSSWLCTELKRDEIIGAYEKHFGSLTFIDSDRVMWTYAPEDKDPRTFYVVYEK